MFIGVTLLSQMPVKVWDFFGLQDDQRHVTLKRYAALRGLTQLVHPCLTPGNQYIDDLISIVVLPSIHETADANSAWGYITEQALTHVSVTFSGGQLSCYC